MHLLETKKANNFCKAVSPPLPIESSCSDVSFLEEENGYPITHSSIRTPWLYLRLHYPLFPFYSVEVGVRNASAGQGLLTSPQVKEILIYLRKGNFLQRA